MLERAALDRWGKGDRHADNTYTDYRCRRSLDS